jgi:hypothetical protein
MKAKRPGGNITRVEGGKGEQQQDAPEKQEHPRYLVHGISSGSVHRSILTEGALSWQSSVFRET